MNESIQDPVMYSKLPKVGVYMLRGEEENGVDEVRQKVIST